MDGGQMSLWKLIVDVKGQRKIGIMDQYDRKATVTETIIW